MSERMYPPTRNLTSASHTISGQEYGNGTYVTVQSDTYNTTEHGDGYSAFNESFITGPHFNADYYNSGYYNVFNGKHLVDDYYGDWITIKLPVQINLTKYGFKQRGSASSYTARSRAPGEYKIYGSNDGINWSDLVHKTSNITYSGLYFEESISTRVMYNYFGVVVNKLHKSSGNSNNMLNFDEWYIYGNEHNQPGRSTNIPTMKVVSGSQSKRNPNPSFGDIRYNTDNNYIEIHHADNNNSTDWRELITNNKLQIDISGKLIVSGDLSVNGNIIAKDVSFNKIGEYNTDNGITFLNDVSFNGNVVSNDGDLGFAGKMDILVNNSDGSNRYRFTGNGLDGTEDNPTIYLMRGSKYKFINTTGSHAIEISSQLDNPGGAGYNKGFIGGTTATFNVPQDAPDELYYYCTASHVLMKGTLKIVGAGGGGIESGTDVSFGHIDASSISVAGDITTEYIAARGNINVGSSGSSAEITATGEITGFYDSSDKRLKTNVTDIHDFNHIIKNIKGVRFNWNENAVSINPNVDLSKVELGVIAQEIEEYMPEVIKEGINNYKAVRYEKIIPILIECIKDSYKNIEILENKHE